MLSTILPYFYCKKTGGLKNISISFKIQGFLKKISQVSFWGDLESMMTIRRLDPGLFTLIVPFTHCWLTCCNFRYTGLPSFPLPTQKEESLFCLWEGFLFPVMLSNAYFKTAWINSYLKWIIHPLISQHLVASVASITVKLKGTAELKTESTKIKASSVISKSTQSFIREGGSHPESTDFFSFCGPF